MSSFLVYKLTSPSGKHYIGYTSKTLDQRLTVHKNDRQRLISIQKHLPRFYSAWSKYPIEDWTKEILHAMLSEDTAKQLEINEIQNYNTLDVEFGYNMAYGGNGGNTGRNGEEWKRTQHSECMKQRHKDNPQMASNSAKLNWENSKRNGTYEARCTQISERTPTGKDHWNHTGKWVVNHNEYDTIVEAAQKEKLNEWTVNEYCNNSEKIFKKDCVLGKRNKSRRECGFYRLPEE